MENTTDNTPPQTAGAPGSTLRAKLESLAESYRVQGITHPSLAARSAAVEFRKELMAVLKESEVPTAIQRRFYWQQCYELDGGVHWALCDTKTDQEDGPHRVTDCYMILTADYPMAMDGKSVGEQFLPALVAQLLTEWSAATDCEQLHNLQQLERDSQ